MDTKMAHSPRWIYHTKMDFVDKKTKQKTHHYHYSCKALD